MKHRKKGFTLIELLVVMSIIALLLSILVPALGRARAQAMLLKDSSQVKAIADGWTTWTSDHDGSYPIPGLEQRLQDPVLGDYIKGRGPEDISLNDHGSMLSMCVMQNLFTTDILWAPTDPNGAVYVDDDYDFDIYNPTPSGADSWTFWDPSFDNALTNNPASTETCNNSYGIMPITGERRFEHWGISLQNDSGFAVLGTRGPELGIVDIDNPSLSLGFHGIDNEWKGVIGYGDNHTEVTDTFYPENVSYTDNTSGTTTPDNLFSEDTVAVDPAFGSGEGTGHDVILSHIAQGEVNENDGKFGGVSGFRHD
ncbi:MAG: type II secretion system protein [Phycisphaerales bacterium]|nr:type II secretion system protein [Phycisphaerales bacterium]MDP6693720.1 type II secretion system protein [Phycisphaerales bacterium]